MSAANTTYSTLGAWDIGVIFVSPEDIAELNVRTPVPANQLNGCPSHRGFHACWDAGRIKSRPRPRVCFGDVHAMLCLYPRVTLLLPAGIPSTDTDAALPLLIVTPPPHSL